MVSTRSSSKLPPLLRFQGRLRGTIAKESRTRRQKNTGRFSGQILPFESPPLIQSASLFGGRLPTSGCLERTTPIRPDGLHRTLTPPLKKLLFNAFWFALALAEIVRFLRSLL